jgi:DNA-binding IclR family transcriptional regulator
VAQEDKRLLLQTLKRGLEILDHLGDQENGARPTDIARQFNLNLNTAGRLLATLEASGYASRGSDGRYSIGPGLIATAIKKVNLVELGKAARPILERLRDRTLETVFVVTRLGHSLIIVDCVEGSHDLRVVLRPGMVAPLFPATTGYVLTADLPAAEAVALSELLEDPKRLVTEAEVKRARKELDNQGYLVRHAAITSAGTCTIATPVHRNGRLVASLGIAGPSDRWNEKTIKPHLKFLLTLTRELSEGHED